MKTERASIFTKPRTTVCLCALLFTLSAFAAGEPSARTAIIGAFDEEVRLIQERMKDGSEQSFLGVTFSMGTLNGQPIVLAKTGIGKVNAAITTTLLLDRFKPSEVIFTGIAGGLNPSLLPGDVIIAGKLAQHDLGDFLTGGFSAKGVRNPTNGKRNPVFFPSDSVLVELSQQAATNTVFATVKTTKGERRPNVITGVIVTGDIFVGSEEKKQELRKRFSADAVEMEGAAVAQVCHQQGVPLVVLRSLSDQADRNAQADARRFYRTAARNSAELVFQLVGLLTKAKGQD